MLRKKIRKSLTVRIFLITAFMLLGAGAITFGLIAWATPSTYIAVLNDDLTNQVNALVERLGDTTLDECGPVLDAFLRDSGADVMLVGPDEQIINTGSQFAIQSVYEGTDHADSTADDNSTVTYATDGPGTDESVTVTMSNQATITADVSFSNQSDVYTLYVTCLLYTSSQMEEAWYHQIPEIHASILLHEFRRFYPVHSIF